MSTPTAKIKFVRECADHLPGAAVDLPEPMARHLVDCGLATFVAAPEPAELPVERADARPAKHVQRATK
jgi:hypothetical protein